MVKPNIDKFVSTQNMEMTNMSKIAVTTLSESLALCADHWEEAVIARCAEANSDRTMKKNDLDWVVDWAWSTREDAEILDGLLRGNGTVSLRKGRMTYSPFVRKDESIQDETSEIEIDS